MRVVKSLFYDIRKVIMSGKLDKHLKERGTHFTCVTNNQECIENIKKTVIDFPSWAWIDHEPDDEEGKPHTHFMFRTNGSRTIKQVADKLEISGQYIQLVHKQTGLYRYFIHKDHPNRKQYKLDDIQTNHIDDFRNAIEGVQRKSSVYSLFTDIRKLQMGMINADDFIKLNYQDFSSLSFGAKIKTFETILKLESVAVRTT